MEKEKAVTWSQLTGTRKRYDKESGRSYYERIFIGILAGGEAAKKNEYINLIPGLKAGEMVYVFTIGSRLDQKNVAFIYRKGDSIVYGNPYAGSRARDYTNFYANKAGAEIQWIEGLPAVERTHTGGTGAIESLDDALAKAEAMVIDF